MTSTRRCCNEAAFVLIEAPSDVVAKNIFRAKLDNASNVAQAIIAYWDYIRKTSDAGHSPSATRPIAPAKRSNRNYLINALSNSGLKNALNCLLVRASMVIILD